MIAESLTAVLAQSAVSQLLVLYKQRAEGNESDNDVVLDELVAEYGLPDPDTSVNESTKRLADRLESSPKATEAGLALSPDAVFRETRTRLRLFFRINVGVCLAVSTILIGALAASIILALMGETTLAAVFGALTLGDILFAAVYGPLNRIETALLATQRLDIIHLSTRERLQAARELSDPAARARETERIWDDIKNDLAALSAPASSP